MKRPSSGSVSSCRTDAVKRVHPRCGVGCCPANPEESANRADTSLRRMPILRSAMIRPSLGDGTEAAARESVPRGAPLAIFGRGVWCTNANAAALDTGRHVRRGSSDSPQADHNWLLAALEQRAKRRGDLDICGIFERHRRRGDPKTSTSFFVVFPDCSRGVSIRRRLRATT